MSESRILFTIVVLLGTLFTVGRTSPTPKITDNRMSFPGGNPVGLEVEGGNQDTDRISKNPHPEHEKSTKSEGFVASNVGNSNNKNNNSSSRSDSQSITEATLDLQKQLSDLRNSAAKNAKRESDLKEITNPISIPTTSTSNADLEQSNALESGEKKVPTITLDKEYTPQDIAEYIFWTSDERGVAIAINDLINDGLMPSRDDVIKFLEDVLSELEYLRNRYEKSISRLIEENPPIKINSNHPYPALTKSDEEESRSSSSDHQGITFSSTSTNSLGSFETKFQHLLEQAENKRSREQKTIHRRSSGGSGIIVGDIRAKRLQIPSDLLHYYPKSGAYDTHTARQLVTGDKNKKSSLSKTSGSLRYYFPAEPQLPPQEVGDEEDDDEGHDDESSYNNNNIQIQIRNNNQPDLSEVIDERMKVADDKLRELSLEHVIYNLARELFTENFKEGEDYYHEDQTERFSRLIPERTPKELQKEIFDTLFTALAQSAKEQRESEYTSASRSINRRSRGYADGNRVRRKDNNNKRDIHSTRQINPEEVHLRFNGLSGGTRPHQNSLPHSYTPI